MIKPLTYLLFLSLVLLCHKSNAQSQIEIINADKISYNKKINEDRQLLIGNVKTKHENRFLNCDSAYYYAKENRIEAFDNINIWQGDTLSLKGDYLIYHGNHQLAEIQRNVHFRHNEMTLESQNLNFNFNINEGYFDTKGTITSKEKSLSSSKGVYYSDIEKFDFYGDVLVEDEKETLKADTLFYWLKTEYASFSSNGIIENKDFEIKAQRGWVNQREGNAFLSSQVEITQIEDAYKMYADTCYISDQMKQSISYGNTLLYLPFNSDSLYLTADTLINNQNTKLLKAYTKVSFKTESLTGHCDSLSYNTENSTIYLNSEPVLWLEDFQLTADTITLLLLDDELDKAYLNKNAFIASKLDSISVNQISGVNMQANFKDNTLNTINVSGNGESIYYIEDEETGQNVGLNKIICSNMDITIEQNKLKNIKFLEKPTATLYPIGDITKDLRFLKHYKSHKKELILKELESKTHVHKGF